MDKSLSVVIVGNTNKKLMEFAVEKTLENLPRCDKVLVVSDEPINLSSPYEFLKISSPFGICEYSDFIIKSLSKFIETDQCLIIQYDGFAVNKQKWRDEFLEYDFIGTPVSPLHPPMLASIKRAKSNIVDLQEIVKKAEWKTGGGGFNIRSKKFLDACANDPEIIPWTQDATNESSTWYCDDLTLNFIHDKKLKEEYGIKFAPLSESLNFGSEIATTYGFAFGFHGWYHIGLHLKEEEIVYYMENLKRQNVGNYGYETAIFLGFLWMRGLIDLFNYYSKKYDIDMRKKLGRQVWPQRRVETIMAGREI